MKTLHIFNPEHDIALAADLSNFTAPHAGRQLRSDLGWLPALWADGDDVLVDHVESAERLWSVWKKRYGKYANISRSVTFIDSSQLQENAFDKIAPWGWDKALYHALKKDGVHTDVLPTAEMLELVRRLSHRRIAVTLLPQLQMSGTIGNSCCTDSMDVVESWLSEKGQIVLKAPWSSSGRGVRFVCNSLTDQQKQWTQNIIFRQGSIIVEPFYNKIKDFGMEFEVGSDGKIHYLGLSLFHTRNGAYTGNILATEQTKTTMISRYVPASLLDRVKDSIIEHLDLEDYRGPFGVDMMVVSDTSDCNDHSNYCLHPCVEVNLRRTMGHVALALTPIDDDVVRVMRIDFNGNNYKLKIQLL